MAENNKGLIGQLGEVAKSSPAVDKLRDEANSYLQAKGQDLAKNLGGKLEGFTERLQDQAENGGFVFQTAKNVAQGDSPGKAVTKSAAGSLKDKVKGIFGGGGGGSTATKSTVIIEEIDIGAPVSVVYNQWTQFQDYSGFMKKVEHAELEEDDDEVEVDFKAQVFWSHRRWTGTVKEQVPDELISWRSQGEKGHVDGTVTFHEVAPRLTRVLVVLEYYPQGFMERTGNIWRAQGRRARLELKHFRRHVMMNAMHEPEQLEGWRGVVHDEELERSHDEVVEEEQQSSDEPEDEGEPEDEYDEGEPEDEDEDEPEAEYDEEAEGDEEGEPEDEYDEEEPEEGEEEEGEEEEPEDEYDEYEEEEEPEGEYDEEAEEEEPEEEYETVPPRRRRAS
jgi:uncharacterized membrane protein